jgi:aerobic-type carbon monoxide dehydrogenase small subunit (CoxS/CutS family)
MPAIAFQLNGQPKSVEVSPDTPLLWVLRDTLNLTGTKYGCGIAQCGACSVHINGQVIRSCVTPISSVSGKRVTTIEGLSPDGNHPLQQAWIAEQVPQCGYCQSGQIMTAAAFLQKTPKPKPSDVDRAMSNNICRCGTAQRMRAAILLAADMMSAHAAAGGVL